jgi:hypothetical protein
MPAKINSYNMSFRRWLRAVFKCPIIFRPLLVTNPEVPAQELVLVKKNDALFSW